MTYLAALELALKYAPQAEKLIGQLASNVFSGRALVVVPDSDWAELDRLGKLTAEAIFAARGVNPPPAS